MLGQQGVPPRAQQRVFVRGVTHSSQLEDPFAAETALQKALDELQLAVLDKAVAPSASSHLFLHILPAFESAVRMLSSLLLAEPRTLALPSPLTGRAFELLSGQPEPIIEQWKVMMSNLISK